MFIFPVPASAGAAIVVASYESTATSTADATNYTHSGVAIGTASAGRRVVVMVTSTYNSAIGYASATIGGVSATIHFNYANTTDQHEVGFISAVVPTGTTADVVVNGSGSKFRQSIAVFATTGMSSTAHDTASANSGAPLDLSIDVPANGVIFGGCRSSTSGNTWAVITEVVDGTDEVGYGAAFDTFVSASTPASVTVEPGGGQDTGAAISFGPA